MKDLKSINTRKIVTWHRIIVGNITTALSDQSCVRCYAEDTVLRSFVYGGYMLVGSYMCQYFQGVLTCADLLGRRM